MSMKQKLTMAMATTALGAALLAGGSFALFTSTDTNSGNSFAAGTVKISMDKPDGTTYFNVSNIAPGDKGSSKVTVKNNGSLELRYDIAQTLTGALASGANPLAVTIKDADGKVIVPGDNNRVLAAGASEVLTVSWELPRAAGNEYQGASASLGITVNAEQTKNNP